MMRVDSRQLLRRLEPAVRPAGPGPSQTGSTPIDRAGFDDLLARAGRGEFQSGRELDDTALEEPLDPAVRERISRIADAAEAAGHERILVIAGDQPLLLGVSERRVDGELEASNGVGDTIDRLQAVEAAVRLHARADAWLHDWAAARLEREMSELRQQAVAGSRRARRPACASRGDASPTPSVPRCFGSG